jgi:hypothetical protein
MCGFSTGLEHQHHQCWLTHGGWWLIVERFSLAESEATVTIAFLDGFAISANVFSMSHTISILQ